MKSLIIPVAILLGSHAQAATLNKIEATLLLCIENTFNVETGDIIDVREALVIDGGNQFTAISSGASAAMSSGPLVKSQYDEDWVQPSRGYSDPNYVPGSEATIVKYGGDLEGVYSYSRFPAIYLEWDCRKQ